VRGAFDETFDISVKGLVFTVLEALPLLSDGASVILPADHRIEALGVSAASKAAVRSRKPRPGVFSLPM
jgi:hypothetical protein